MSGTSLDGVDIAYCYFTLFEGKWSFEIENAACIPYKKYWKDKLRTLYKQRALAFQKTHIEYGNYLGNLVKDFINKYNCAADFVASHGHTVFHEPENNLTVQIGNGPSIAAISKLPVVCDFRSTDVALGGQGAPLVPVADQLLFSEYNYCINLGGIANISFEHNSQRIAFDICPCNIILNYLAEQCTHEYDKEGMIASSGSINQKLLNTLNDFSYYKNMPPKSLDKLTIEKTFLPLINNSNISIKNKLRTVTEHIAIQINNCIIKSEEPISVLITGGGAFNKFLIDRIKYYCKNTAIVVPDKKLVKFKEALCFAFLGVLRIKGETNCLKSVTGASKDSCGGALYYEVIN